jgi:endogenous inhibitor of DNA gyrase (YacG/DUF329 family)
MRHFTCDICNSAMEMSDSLWPDMVWMGGEYPLTIEPFHANEATGKRHFCSFKCAVVFIERWIAKEQSRMERNRASNPRYPHPDEMVKLAP